MGKNVSDLISDNVRISWDGVNGTVTGDIKKVENWTQFNVSDPNEQSGHFFPVSLASKYKGQEITVTGSKVKKAFDTEWVLRVDDQKTFTFECDGKTIFVLDLTKATLAA